MDNIKTGEFIRTLRKEKSMTQKDLAEQLHITDRAVSKWERGLCAPDISLLEPLSRILGVSVLELIQGGRKPQEDRITEEGALTILDYSQNEIRSKVSGTQKKYALLFLGIMAALLLGVLYLWYQGYFGLIEKQVSPDGITSVSVYATPPPCAHLSKEGTYLVEERKDPHTKEKIYTYILYGGQYEGLWWSPDSKKYVVSLQDENETRMVLNWLERNSSSNLNAYLTMGVEYTELSQYGYAQEEGWPDIEYQFLQWALDGRSMLIYYNFEDRTGKIHEGYFWYNCEEGTVAAVMEMDLKKPVK